MKTFLILALVCAGAPKLSFAAEAAPTIRLFVQDKQVALPDGAQELVGKQIIALVQSSNFHSGPSDKYHIFSFSSVQQDYRDAVAAGEYALVIFSSARKISTVEGDVTAMEIVIGLRSPGGKNSVFTIDQSGTVVSHAKYSGDAFLKLQAAIAQAHP